MKSKQAQLTIFVIVGMMVLLIMGLLMYMVFSTNTQQQETQEKEITKTNQASQKYQKFISSCLEQATKNGVKLVAQNGGVIYPADYTTPTNAPQSTTQIHQINQIATWVTSPDLTTGYRPGPPQYPYGSTPLVTQPEFAYFGNFPKSPIIPLCDSFGPNKILKLSCGTHAAAYDSKTNIHDHNSIQQHLQNYIKQETIECINLDSIPELSGYEISNNQINVSVAIAETSVISTFSIPTLLTQESSSSSQFSDVSVTIKSRLKQIHEFAYYLVANDIKNVFFNVNTDFTSPEMLKCFNQANTKVQCARQGMKVTRKKQVNPQNNQPYSIIQITDEFSKIEGEPLMFQITSENRIPALDYIKDIPTLTSLGITQNQNLNEQIDLYFTAGSLIDLTLAAYDPDEDFHNAQNMMNQGFTLSGWGVEYKTEYKLTQTQKGDWVPTACILDGSATQKIEKYLSLKDNPTCFSTKQLSSNSPDTKLKLLGNKLTYQTTLEDVGIHTIKIMVCDNAPTNACDWQEVHLAIMP